MYRNIKKYIAYIIIAAMLTNTAIIPASSAYAQQVYDEAAMHRQAELLRAEQGITYEGDIFLEEVPDETFDQNARPPYPVSPSSNTERTSAEQRARRLQQIQAYRSSPTIPWTPWQFAGLRLTGTNGEIEEEAASQQSSPWDILLEKQRAEEQAHILAVINSGTVIPALLISGLNSDLPGHIVAQVSEHIFDSPTGKRLLIPQGSRLFGDYDSKVIFGQKRPLVKWTKLIYPDGSTMDLNNMPGSERSGYAGFKASVNNHFGPMLGTAVLVSVFAGLADSFDERQQTITLNQPKITLPDYVPVGTVVAWGSPEPPEGWLLCDGSQFDTSLYPELYETLGSDKLPNYTEAEGADIGTVAIIPGMRAPYGYLECDGRTFDTEEYPELATYLGTDRLPDYRGVFLRGANHGRGDGRGDTDEWRTAGTYQADATSDHTHTGVATVSGQFTGLGTSTGTGYATLTGPITGTGYGTMSGTAQTSGFVSLSGTSTGSGTASLSGTIYAEPDGAHSHYLNLETSSAGLHRHLSMWDGGGGNYSFDDWDGDGSLNSWTSYAGQHTHYVSGNTTEGGLHSHTGTAYVSGNIYTTGTANVSGEVNTTGTAQVSGQVDVTGTATVSGPIEVNGPVEVSGFGEFTGGVVISPDHTTAEETRPRNMAVTYAIKAYGADKRYWIIKAAPTGVSPYGRAALAGLIGTSAEVKDEKGNPYAHELAESLSDMADKLLEKWIEVAPTLIVKPGYRFSVIVNREIAMPVKTRFR